MACETKRSIFDLIDLGYPGLEEVKKAVEAKNFKEAAIKLKTHYITRKYPVLFLKYSEKQKLINYAKDNYKSDIDEIIKVAEEVSNNTFVFRFPWDMEKTNIPVSFEKEIIWDHIPSKDEEWAFMLNRHRYWIALGQAYWCTGNEKYAKTFTEQLDHWIDNNPKDGEGAEITWRSIEAGIRCESWIKAYEYFKDSVYFTEDLLVKMLLCLYDHCEYIMSRFDYFRHISNWGVLENHGLFEASLFLLEFKKGKQWQEQSINRLKECAGLQVMQDGMQWEQSPMYHNEVLHCFMDIMIIAKKNNIFLNDIIKEKTKNMAYADLYMAKPNHHQPLQSDSDDTDLRDMLTEAAMIFKDGTLKFGGYKNLDFNSLWIFGLEGVKIYEEILSKPPENISKAFESSGNYVMRSSWQEDALYLYFDCGPIGGGHGHADILHFDVNCYGKDLLSDIGRYTYVENEPLRDYFKGCRAHNTIIVDDVEFTKGSSSWGNSKIASPCGQKWISEEKFDYVEGSHTGYRDLEDPVYPIRRIVFVKPCYWIVIDSFDCKKSHSFLEYFHFPPGEVKINEETKECSTCFRDGGNLRIIPVKHNNLESKIENGLYSREYNSKEENKILSYNCKNIGFTSLITILYPEKEGTNTSILIEKVDVYTNKGLVSDSFADAVKIIFKESKEEHILFVRHNKTYTKQPDLSSTICCLDGTFVRGEVVLIKRKDKKEEIIVIK